MIEPLLDIDKAAETLSISPWTLRLYIRTGKIHPVRIGRRLLLSQDELRRVIEQGGAPIQPAKEKILAK